MMPPMPETHPEIREAVRRLCARFPGPYWQALDRERAYPTAFVQAYRARTSTQFRRF